YIRASHSQVGEYCSHLPMNATYPSFPSSCGNCRTSGRIQTSHVSAPVVGMDSAVLDATVRYWVAPSKSAATSPFGSVADDFVPATYVPVWPLPVRSGSVPDAWLIAQYATG